MSFVETFINSDFFNWFVLPVIIIVVILWMFAKIVFNKPLGSVIMDVMGNRPLKLEEIDAQAHPRLVEESKHAAILSKDRNARWLCIEAYDDIHYTTNRGRKVIGKIVGMSTYQTRVEIVFRRPWRFKKFIFIAPPDMIRSGSSNRFIVFDGMSLKMITPDYCYPIPSYESKYDENDLDIFAMHHYDAKITLASNAALNPMGETMILKSASDTATVRMQREAIRQHIWRSETDVEAQRAQQQAAAQQQSGNNLI